LESNRPQELRSDEAAVSRSRCHTDPLPHGAAVPWSLGLTSRSRCLAEGLPHGTHPLSEGETRSSPAALTPAGRGAHGPAMGRSPPGSLFFVYVPVLTEKESNEGPLRGVDRLSTK